jgi:hypothetical protein
MGDGNLQWLARATDKGVRFVHVRHEGAAIVMAHGYAKAAKPRAPGHLRRRHDPGHTQPIDQQRFVEACGAEFLPVRSAASAATAVHQRSTGRTPIPIPWS